MIDDTDGRPSAGLLFDYQNFVQRLHPTEVARWPLINGWNLLSGSFGDWAVAVFQDAPFSPITRQSGLGELSPNILGADQITDSNRSSVRGRLEKHFNIGSRDAIVLFPPKGTNGSVEPDMQAMFQRHKIALGLAAMKIFLSHKGVDKEMVRRFERVLRQLGFDPWLDEDAMPAGAQPDRAIQKGFKDSCAAVFFVTPDFKDETWLATEIEYARTERREKGEARFAIITLCLAKDGRPGAVPDLLKHFIYKSPQHELEAMLEIIRALPIKVGDPRFP